MQLAGIKYISFHLIKIHTCGKKTHRNSLFKKETRKINKRVLNSNILLHPRKQLNKYRNIRNPIGLVYMFAKITSYI